MIDPSESDLTAIGSYNTYYNAGDFTSAQAVLTANPTLVNMLITADVINKLDQRTIAIERLYASDVQTFLTNANNITTDTFEFPSDSKTVTQFRIDIEAAIALLTTDILAGYTKAASVSDVADGDTIKEALGKIEKKAEILLDDAVTTSKILDANVTADKLADNAVTTDKILDENVTANKLATDSVETAKIKDANVTNSKLATNAVTTAKILDANVTQSKLGTIGEVDVYSSTKLKYNGSSVRGNLQLEYSNPSANVATRIIPSIIFQDSEPSGIHPDDTIWFAAGWIAIYSSSSGGWVKIFSANDFDPITV